MVQAAGVYLDGKMILCGGATLNLDDYSLSKYTVTVFQIYYAIVFPDYNVWGIIIY